MFLSPGIEARQHESNRDRRIAAELTASQTLHRVCVADGIYVIAFLFFLNFSLVVVRRHFGHMQSYDFIRLNLFLATLPYGLSLCTGLLYRVAPSRRWPIALYGPLLLLLYVLWLLFLPNAPYLLTDFTHLEDKTHLQVLYDTVMLGTYAVTGYALAAASLTIMQRPIRALLGKHGSWFFVIVCCFLAGIGVHLGRAQRFNSWDLFSQSTAVLGTVLDRVFHIYNHPHTLSDGLYYGTLLLVGYGVFRALGSKTMENFIVKWRTSTQN
jgi:uncharacterized membrane protein